MKAIFSDRQIMYIMLMILSLLGKISSFFCGLLAFSFFLFFLRYMNSQIGLIMKNLDRNLIPFQVFLVIKSQSRKFCS